MLLNRLILTERTTGGWAGEGLEVERWANRAVLLGPPPAGRGAPQSLAATGTAFIVLVL